MAGTLWVIATPIGNLEDLSPRARTVLAAVDAVLAEDTRRTRALLASVGIERPLLSLHEHNERKRSNEALARLQGGESLALVSDAGTPLISDPGFRLVRAAREVGVPVRPVPGPSAAIVALSVAGIPCERFCFEGFLPAAPIRRKARLSELAHETRTMVFFEAPQRIEAMLEDAMAVFGERRRACLARELCKLHETLLGPDLLAIAERLRLDPEQRLGEMTLVVAGLDEPEPRAMAEGKRLYRLLATELPPARAAKLAASFTGLPRACFYGGDGDGD
ncbi:MAG: ribosomal RNA small subunit methyltransferase I [Lysobacterales bacterium]|jgi:16S rRNA (cytidine1402-2'-O)-methyltransferase|nr:MAG: ribosomal RNA small subunit methyltransferase I [Xanthomonadales bacterium]